MERLLVMEVWITAIALTVGLLFARSYRQSRESTRQMRSFAKSLQLSFSKSDVVGIRDRFRNLDLITRGHNRRPSNIAYGTLPEGFVTVFEYCYELGFGSGARRKQETMAIIETPSPVNVDPSLGGVDKPAGVRFESRSRLIAAAAPGRGSHQTATQLLQFLRTVVKESTGETSVNDATERQTPLVS